VAGFCEHGYDHSGSAQCPARRGTWLGRVQWRGHSEQGSPSGGKRNTLNGKKASLNKFSNIELNKRKLFDNCDFFTFINSVSWGGVGVKALRY